MSKILDITEEKAANKYDACLVDFTRRLLSYNRDNVLCIILYGGLVRDGEPIIGWSDIDLIVVYGDILSRDSVTLSRLLNLTEKKFSIRIDLTQIDAHWLEDPRLLANCYNSEAINALAMRPNVSRILYGTPPPVSFSVEHEKIAARFYISHTLGAFRRYLTEDVLCHNTQHELKYDVARITRWVFSIIRASLRLFNVYVHPYGPSLEQVKVQFPQMDLSVPYALLSMRKDPTNIKADLSLFVSVEAFLEKYVPFVLREATMHEKT